MPTVSFSHMARGRDNPRTSLEARPRREGARFREVACATPAPTPRPVRCQAVGSAPPDGFGPGPWSWCLM